MNIAVIPARGGSKRIPRKNIRNFCGKPIIAWPIGFAKASSLFDRIIVSTDDTEIADISIKHGAEVPFMRPNKLSDDHAGTHEVIAHAISFLQDEGVNIDKVCCIYPTSVFLDIDSLKRGFKHIMQGKWKYSISVTEFAHNVFRSFEISESEGLKMFFPGHEHVRTQDLAIPFHDAAQFYWGTIDAWLSNSDIFDNHTFPVVIPRNRVQDIDSEEDWNIALNLFNSLKNENSL